MSQRVDFFFLDPWSFIDADERNNYLGCIVKDFKAPTNHAERVPKAFGVYLPPVSFRTVPANNVTINYCRSDQIRRGGGFEEVLEVTRSSSASAYIKIVTNKAEYVRVNDEHAVLECLKSDANFLPNTKKWYHGKLSPRHTACMIVGMLICDGSEVEDNYEDSREDATTVTAPAVSLATAFTLGNPISAGNPHLTYAPQSSAQQSMKATFTDRKIVGFEYRSINKRVRKLEVGKTGPQLEASDEESEVESGDEVELNSAGE